MDIGWKGTHPAEGALSLRLQLFCAGVGAVGPSVQWQCFPVYVILHARMIIIVLTATVTLSSLYSLDCHYAIL